MNVLSEKNCISYHYTQGKIDILLSMMELNLMAQCVYVSQESQLL